MSTDIIVSYDGTSNDDDALALGRMLAGGGATLALAYVRHSREFDPRREGLAQHDAQRRLALGAAWLDDPDLPCHVVVNASTGAGLAKLAQQEEASMIVFGSDYRTPPGRAEPGASAQGLLEGGSVAIAVAPAGLRSEVRSVIESIAISPAGTDVAASETAQNLAQTLGATIRHLDGGDVDLIVVGSQATVPEGRIALSSAARVQLSSARSAVLVVPYGKLTQL